MTNETKAMLYKVRLEKMKTRGNHIKNPGVFKKVSRQLRNLEK